MRRTFLALLVIAAAACGSASPASAPAGPAGAVTTTTVAPPPTTAVVTTAVTTSTSTTRAKVDPAKVSAGGSVEVPDIAGYTRSFLKTAVLDGVTVQRTQLLSKDGEYEVVVKEFPPSKAPDGKRWTPAALGTAIRNTYSDRPKEFGPDRNDPGIGANFYRQDGTYKWRYIFTVTPGGTGLSVSFIGLIPGYETELAPKEKPFMDNLRFTGQDPA